MKNKGLIALTSLVVVLLGCACFYFLYFIKTPAYALNSAREAAQAHDLAKFQQHVDLDSVMDDAFNEIIKGESKVNQDGIFNNPFAVSILHMLKPAVVNLMIQEAQQHVVGEETNNEEKEAKVDPVPDAMRRNMESHVPLKKLTFKDLSIAKEEDGQAIATIAVHHNELDKDFAFELIMKKNNQGDWQVKKIANLADIIVQFEAAKRAKQASADEEIMNRLNKAVTAGDIHLIVIHDANPEREQSFLSASVAIKNNGSSTINRMYYDVSIFDEQGKMIYSYPEQFRGELRPGQEQTLNTRKALNDLLPDDKMIMKLDMEKQKASIRVTYIAYSDGNVISPSPFMNN